MRYFIPRMWTGWHRMGSISEEVKDPHTFFVFLHNHCKCDLPTYFFDCTGVGANLAAM